MSKKGCYFTENSMAPQCRALWDRMETAEAERDRYKIDLIAAERAAVTYFAERDRLKEVNAEFEQLARDAISDLHRYARGEGFERRMVSAQTYEKALAKLVALAETKELTP